MKISLTVISLFGRGGGGGQGGQRRRGVETEILSRLKKKQNSATPNKHFLRISTETVTLTTLP